jgi:hypothetical protein
MPAVLLASVELFPAKAGVSKAKRSSFGLSSDVFAPAPMHQVAHLAKRPQSLRVLILSAQAAE